jgi:hypothetical protein
MAHLRIKVMLLAMSLTRLKQIYCVLDYCTATKSITCVGYELRSHKNISVLLHTADQYPFFQQSSVVNVLSMAA